MPSIYDKELVARQLKTGISILAEHNDYKKINIEYELANKLGIFNKKGYPAARRIQSWQYESSIPSLIDDGYFFGIIWHILKTGMVGMNWLECLLNGTSIPIYKPVSVHLLRSYLKQARIRNKPPSEEDIDVVVNHLFHKNVDSIDTKFSDNTLLSELIALDPIPTQQYIQSAKIISASGISLFRFIPAFNYEFITALKRGTMLRILLVDPDSPAIHMAAFRSTSRTPAGEQREHIISSIKWMNRFREHAPDAKVELRFLDYLPPYGITIYQHKINPGKSICQVRLFTFRTPTSKAPLITPNPIQDMYWFKFFSDQFDMMWDAAKKR